tara:strand:+ start:134 stop:445 length:312 start_codon:yes stop_codon:yes gene_type:complete
MPIEQPDKNWKVDAIYSLKPGAKWCLRDDDLSWEEGNSQTEPTNAEINAEIIRLQADYDAKEYQRKREREYPSWQEQLDDIYHNGVTEWKKTIKVTKDKYPKP